MSRILLIDDEPDLLLAFVCNHRHATTGVEVVVARTGDEGVRAAVALAPDVVLLDVHLPDLSGLEVYRSSCARSTPAVPSCSSPAAA